MRHTLRLGGLVVIACLAVALVLGTALVVSRLSGGVPGFGANALRERVESVGPAGPLLFIALLAAVVIVAPIPNTPFFIVAGLVWGPVLGSIYSMAGLLAGSFAAFLLARLIPRRVLAALVGRQAWRRMIRITETATPWVVFWARLLPATNFDWINYLAGLTAIGALPFVLATAAGTAPATIATVAAGSSIEDNLPLSIALTVVWLTTAGASVLFVSRRRSSDTRRLI